MTPDVIVVGTGATGSIVADHHVRAGRNVLILERGEDKPYAPEIRQHWWFESTEFKKESGLNLTRNSWDDAANAQGAWVHAKEAGYDDLVEIENEFEHLRFGYNMRLGYGGSSAVWSGRVWRFYPSDFQVRTRFGYSRDWPVSAEDLAPFYAQAEQMLRVSGPRDGSWPFPQNFQFDAFGATYLDKVISSMFAHRYRFVETADAAPNIHPAEGGCVGAKTCVQFCPSNALTRHYIELLEPLRKHKNLTISFDTIVTHLDTDVAGRINKIGYTNRAGIDGEITVPVGALVYLCGNTIENIRMLLNSEKKSANQRSIANSSGLLGRYFSSHGATVAEIVAKKSIRVGRGRPSTTAGLDPDLGERRDEVSGHMLEIFNNNWSRGSSARAFRTIRENTGLWGHALFDESAFLSRSTMVTTIFETEMRYDNRITLSSKADRWGVPIARVAHRFGDRDLRTLSILRDRMGEAAKHEDCERVNPSGYGLNGNHPMGGYVASNQANDGVVDAFSRSHDHKNLYVLGGGVFNSTSAFNPTLTISALALRALSDNRDR